jgi:hypothetical protein
MPVMKCPDCDGQVSSKAVACPHCGRFVPAITSREFYAYFFTLAILFVLIALSPAC